MLPKSTSKNFKGWYNTSDNSIYQPGDKIFVNHGIYLKAIHEISKNDYFEMYSQRIENFNFKKTIFK